MRIGHDGVMSLTVRRHASVDEFLSVGGAYQPMCDVDQYGFATHA